MKKGHDAVKHGYRKMAFGADEKVNHRIEGAYVKGAEPNSSEKTNVAQIAKHGKSKMYSDKAGGMDSDGDKD